MTAEQQTGVLETQVDNQETCNMLSDAALIAYLDSLEYGDGTMLDFFMRDQSEVDDTELYTLAYFMGKSLSAQVNNVGLQQAVTRVITDGANAKKDDFAEISKTMEAIDKVSIYDGVDRTLFENGVALTSATTAKNASSGKSWSDGLFNRIFQPETAGEYKWTDFWAFYVMPAVISFTMFGAMTGVLSVLEKHLNTGARAAAEAVVNSQARLASVARQTIELIHDDTARYYTSTLNGVANKASTALFGKGTLLSTTAGGKVLLGIRTFFLAVGVIFTLISLGMAIYTLFSDNVPQITAMTILPTIMCPACPATPAT